MAIKARKYYDIFDIKEEYFKNKTKTYDEFTNQIVTDDETHNGSLQYVDFLEEIPTIEHPDNYKNISDDLIIILKNMQKDLGDEIHIRYWW